MEKVKQMLGLGKDTFTPTSLDAHHRMLSDSAEFLKVVTQFDKVVNKFVDTSTAFLTDVGNFSTHLVTPRVHQHELYNQADSAASPTAVAVPPPPAEHIASFGSDKIAEMAQTTPPFVAERITTLMSVPLTNWVKAYDSAKERLASLERLRLPFDAARRKQAVVDTATPEADAKKYARLVHLRTKYGPGMALFQSLDGELVKHLTWLVEEANRLKTYYSMLLSVLKTGSESTLLPPPVLLPFPADVLTVLPTELFPAQPIVAAAAADGAGTVAVDGKPPILDADGKPVVVADATHDGLPAGTAGEGTDISSGLVSPPIEALPEAGGGKAFKEPATELLRNSLRDTSGAGPSAAPVTGVNGAGKEHDPALQVSSLDVETGSEVDGAANPFETKSVPRTVDALAVDAPLVTAPHPDMAAL